MAQPRRPPQLVDIGINLTDVQYQGRYNGRDCHRPDMDELVDRGKSFSIGHVFD